MKRILVISDTHCGHQAGLTPPDFWYPIIENPDSATLIKRNQIGQIQRDMWGWFTDVIKKYGPFDLLFHLGDNIDGQGHKSGGTELINSDPNIQCEIATMCIEAANVTGSGIVMVYGTPYHTGNISDFENIVAGNVNAKSISGHEQVDVNGCIFDLRHKVGRSSIPHGKATPLLKQALTNLLWVERGAQERASVILRGHVHYECAAGDSKCWSISCPGLEWSTKFGSREVDGIASIGVIIFEVDEKGRHAWNWLIMPLDSLKPPLLHL